jgi:DNA mismatch endonuclease (patch repair protein)
MSRPKIKISRDRLENLYIDKKLSMAKIAEMFNTNSVIIYARLHEYSIPVRTISEALKGKIPWNKGKSSSEKTRRKIAKISKERWNNPEFIKKMEIRNRKLSKIMRGDRNPMKKPEARKKRSIKMIGKLVGDKNPMKKLKTRRKLSQLLKGHKISMRTKEKISKTLNGRYTGEDNPFYGKRHTEEVKKKNRIRAIRRMVSGKIRRKDTHIELMIEAELRKRNIHYKKQFPLANITVADFYLPQNKTVIYADGSFWHESKWAEKRGVVEKDKRQNKILTANGYKVFRFPEADINNSPEKCVSRVIKHINKI